MAAVLSDAGLVPEVGEAFFWLLLDFLGIALIATSILVRLIDPGNRRITLVLSVCGLACLLLFFVEIESSWFSHMYFAIHLTAIVLVVALLLESLLTNSRDATRRMQSTTNLSSQSGDA